MNYGFDDTAQLPWEKLDHDLDLTRNQLISYCQHTSVPEKFHCRYHSTTNGNGNQRVNRKVNSYVKASSQLRQLDFMQELQIMNEDDMWTTMYRFEQTFEDYSTAKYVGNLTIWGRAKEGAYLPFEKKKTFVFHPVPENVIKVDSMQSTLKKYGFDHQKVWI